MSLKPLVFGLLSSITVSGGLAVAAHSAGQVLNSGAEGLATVLVSPSSHPEGEGAPQLEASKPTAPSSDPSGNAPTGAGGTAQELRDATAKKPPALPPAAPAKSTNSAGQRGPNSTHTTRLVEGRPAAPPSVPRVTPRLLRLSHDAPTCDDVYVYIVSIFENIRDSVATLALNANERGRQRRVGQRLGRYDVIGIGYNASRVSSAVWLAEGNRVCQALVRDVNPVREKRQLRQQARAKQVSAAARKARMKQAKRKRAKRGR